mmetsp:Transcript_2685/g.4339  ORF Transcript_2685/g.4339 Transcript_2685/m.4339 type:complete len:123 (-) Transcript_2685:52-420(-)
MGAAFAAGLAVGVWKNTQELKRLWQIEKTYTPRMSESERERNWMGWKKAVTKSLDWVEIDNVQEHFLDAQTYEEDDEIFAPVSSTSKVNGGDSTGILLGSFSMMVVAGIAMGVGFMLGRKKL